MPYRVCPWWLGYFLASPLRRLFSGPPRAVVAPYVRPGMTVLEPGPGMGFFTLELARLVGSGGRVLAVDVQPKMLAGLRRRAGKAGLLERIELRLAEPASLRVEDLAGQVDFTLAFAVVHEMPKGFFFPQAAAASKRGGRLLLAEPRGHVSDERFAKELEAAKAAGFSVDERPAIRGSHAALLTRE